ncbi:muconolactone delta-isomerase [Methylobacterium phyllostachyos]|uniref:Muconolactone Delta-isomerase n=1 Tax=Methylobacterium phyllostachyos TaxID=582672 RepID=A0A1H0C7P0_9HYPH|nr:muconolactone Delta-isomerase family protein [Methylobacterium phyllostachyos]SDN53914.1 muconolactone delta-isomerase [Methylobacterium phyllostachyos]
MLHRQVNIPAGLPRTGADCPKTEGRAVSQKLQRDGPWRHLWRIAGQYAKDSVFDVAGNDERHGILTALSPNPDVTIHVTLLAQHPSAIAAN